MARAFVRHDHHHQVDIFHAGLETPASTADGEECRCAPHSIGEPAGGDAAAMFAADDEGALDEAGYYGDAFGALVNLVGDSLVGSRGEIAQRRGRVVQPRLHFRLGLARARRRGRAKNEKRNGCKGFFHVTSPKVWLVSLIYVFTHYR